MIKRRCCNARPTPRKRFQNVIVSAAANGFEGGGNIVDGGDHDHRDFRVVLTEPFQEFDAVHLRHDHVAEHQVRSGPLNLILRSAPVAYRGAAITFGLQHGGNDFADGFLVINDKYVFDFHGWSAPPGLNRPRSHYKGQHINQLEPLPIQQTACSFTDKYSSKFRPVVRACSGVSEIVKRIRLEAAQGAGESGPSCHRFL
jgi:hypothetical protein